ncbi:helix-turn-helix domain-containing protein [Campylobacter helveticus]|uniref:helix-turn-helix domain-containing protein n=1 Tax=Campylobacter helveticus TaxID=28898 RepID=UPI001115F666|nr:helix-turn-helix domain-containing protein [Campylobacter helveticus]TNH35030.1 helix-turn-helix domain-containing protein [Campylobacter helveticus]TNH37077.1 helix-turn-helix domain-containing protein [Campylobacter helveticus]
MKTIKIVKKDGSFNEQKYYTIKEVADIFGITQATAIKWGNAGKFKVMRFGRQRYILVAEIVDFQQKSIL